MCCSFLVLREREKFSSCLVLIWILFVCRWPKWDFILHIHFNLICIFIWMAMITTTEGWSIYFTIHKFFRYCGRELRSKVGMPYSRCKQSIILVNFSLTLNLIKFSNCTLTKSYALLFPFLIIGCFPCSHSFLFEFSSFWSYHFSFSFCIVCIELVICLIYKKKCIYLLIHFEFFRSLFAYILNAKVNNKQKKSTKHALCYAAMRFDSFNSWKCVLKNVTFFIPCYPFYRKWCWLFLICFFFF